MCERVSACVVLVVPPTKDAARTRPQHRHRRLGVAAAAGDRVWKVISINKRGKIRGAPVSFFFDFSCKRRPHPASRDIRSSCSCTCGAALSALPPLSHLSPPSSGRVTGHLTSPWRMAIGSVIGVGAGGWLPSADWPCREAVIPHVHFALPSDRAWFASETPRAYTTRIPTGDL